MVVKFIGCIVAFLVSMRFASIIRALIKDPEVVILDEPTSALDRESAEKLKIHLQSIKNQKTIIIVSHDTTFYDISDTVVFLPRFVE